MHYCHWTTELTHSGCHLLAGVVGNYASWADFSGNCAGICLLSSGGKPRKNVQTAQAVPGLGHLPVSPCKARELVIVTISHWWWSLGAGDSRCCLGDSLSRWLWHFCHLLVDTLLSSACFLHCVCLLLRCFCYRRLPPSFAAALATCRRQSSTASLTM